MLPIRLSFSRIQGLPSGGQTLRGPFVSLTHVRAQQRTGQREPPMPPSLAAIQVSRPAPSSRGSVTHSSGDVAGAARFGGRRGVPPGFQDPLVTTDQLEQQQHCTQDQNGALQPGRPGGGRWSWRHKPWKCAVLKSFIVRFTLPSEQSDGFS